MPLREPWHYILQPEDEGKKYFEILHHKFHFSRRLLQNLKQGEKAWVDGRFTFLSARGHAGETLTLELFSPEEATIPATSIPASISVSMATDHDSLSQQNYILKEAEIKTPVMPIPNIYPENHPNPTQDISGTATDVAASLGLHILYEDDYILAVNKRAGQVVHPTPRYPQGTLGNDIIAYWKSQGQPRPFRPVHRIDRNTSGVVVIGKNIFAHQQLARQLDGGLIHKRYLGFVSGVVNPDTGLIDRPIGLEPGSFIKREVRADGLAARTEFKVLRRYLRATLLEFILHTGRTHQIRVHCQAMGHPLLGDDLYGGDTALITRQALHAFNYSFVHPANGRMVSIRAPLPPDLTLIIDVLKQQNQTQDDNQIKCGK